MNYTIKKEYYNKKGNRWKLTSIENVNFENFNKASKYYSNVIDDNMFKNRTEYGYSVYGRVSKKSYYSPSGDQKIVYKF